MADMVLYKVFDQEKQAHRYELHFPDGTIDRLKDSKLEYQFNSDSVSFIRRNDKWPLKVKRDANSMKYSCEEPTE
jgi:hypothetical protein